MEIHRRTEACVTWDKGDAVGYNVLWGFAPDKLYHSYMVLGSNEVNIGALVKGQPVFYNATYNLDSKKGVS